MVSPADAQDVAAPVSDRLPAVTIYPPEVRPHSRAKPPRRQQISIKITEEACERFRRLARIHGLTLGDLLEQALHAWETQRRVEGRLDALRLPPA